MEYDEERELPRYVWEYLPDWMTELERLVGRAIIGRQKAASAEGSVANLLAHALGTSGR